MFEITQKQARNDSQVSRLEMTHRLARKHSKAGTIRLKGRQEKTQRQVQKDSKLKGRQERTQRQVRNYSKAGKT